MSLKVNELFSVRDKVVLITGGLTGIGAMMAATFLANGATVVVSSRKASQADADKLLQTCTDSNSSNITSGSRCVAIAADLSTEAGCRLLASEFGKRFTRLDCLINNSGATWGEPLATFPNAAWDKIYALNVKAIFLLTRELLPLLRSSATANVPATVINIGSIDGIRVTDVPHFSYSASKAAVHQLTRVLAAELAPSHINVNAIACGYFHTRMTAGLASLAGEQFMSSMTPRGRSGTARDAGGTAVYLASAAGAWVTGAIVVLDGGVLIKPQATPSGDAKL